MGWMWKTMAPWDIMIIYDLHYDLRMQGFPHLIKLAREYVALPQASCGRIRNKRPTYDELSSMDIMVNHGAPRARTHRHLPHIGVGPLGQLHHPSNSPKLFTNLAEWLQHVS